MRCASSTTRSPLRHSRLGPAPRTHVNPAHPVFAAWAVSLQVVAVTAGRYQVEIAVRAEGGAAMLGSPNEGAGYRRCHLGHRDHHDHGHGGSLRRCATPLEYARRYQYFGVVGRRRVTAVAVGAGMLGGDPDGI